jgi:hypothetical protein
VPDGTNQGTVGGVRPRPRTDGRIEPEVGAWSLAVDRTQRGVLQRLVIDLELGDWAANGFELDPADPEEQSARRRRVECAFWLLDDLGWHTDDERESFVVRIRDEAALVCALRQWRDWQIQAIEDVRRDREAGVPVVRTAPELLAAAERMGVVADLLRQLADERFRAVRPA